MVVTQPSNEAGETRATTDVIEFRAVTFSYGHKSPIADTRETVFDSLDFILPQGQIICLLGPSGCGKTTMINLIMGKFVPDSGEVVVMGEHAPFRQARKRIGYMPQEDALYEDIPAIENLRFFGAMNGMKKDAIRERAAEMLALGRLEDYANKTVASFSGGMKRRLSLGVAMLHDPELLVLDEPTVGLDPGHRKRIWDEFATLARRGKTILVTTHVMDEAARCDNVAMLNAGRIIAVGSPEDIISRTGATSLEDAFLALEGDADNANEAIELLDANVIRDTSKTEGGARHE